MPRRHEPTSTNPSSAASRRGDAEHDDSTDASSQRSAPSGLPAAESVVSESVLVSPKGNRYRVLRTNEHDGYDDPDANLTAERPDAMEEAGMSNAIIRFRSEDARQAFVADVQESWPELRERMYVPTRRPDAIVDHLSNDEMGRLRKVLGRKGKIFADIKFETMDPS